MNLKLFTIPVLLMIISSTTTTATVWATDQSSFEYGYMNGSLKDPQIEAGSNFNPNSNEFANLNGICLIHTASVLNDAAVMPAATNTTACEDGFFAGYKDWCIHHAVDCVENMTMGDFPDMILKAHDQLLAGENAANGSGNSMCPIGNNAVFCNGWDSNNGDYGGQDCSDSPLANISYSLMGCAQDIMTVSQIGGAGLHTLVGTWNYVNQSKGSETMTGTGISGKIVYGANGEFNLTIPLRSPFGNYTLEGAWGYIGHNILTLCYAGGCENSTLTTVTPNHIEFIDNNHNTIHLMKASSHVEQKEDPSVEVGTTAKSISDFNYILNLTGTWAFVNPSKLINSKNLTGAPTITFDKELKYAHWKYTQYCCVVNIQKFVANVGHRIFQGYWQYSYLSIPNTLDLCKYNVQDHGEYLTKYLTKSILSGCTEMTVDVIDDNHLKLHNPSGDTIYLARVI